VHSQSNLNFYDRERHLLKFGAVVFLQSTVKNESHKNIQKPKGTDHEKFINNEDLVEVSSLYIFMFLGSLI
jgi:hypothetical protein